MWDTINLIPWRCKSSLLLFILPPFLPGMHPTEQRALCLPTGEIFFPAVFFFVCLLSCMVDVTRGFLLMVTSSLGSEATALR